MFSFVEANYTTMPFCLLTVAQHRRSMYFILWNASNQLYQGAFSEIKSYKGNSFCMLFFSQFEFNPVHSHDLQRNSKGWFYDSVVVLGAQSQYTTSQLQKLVQGNKHWPGFEVQIHSGVPVPKNIIHALRCMLNNVPTWLWTNYKTACQDSIVFHTHQWKKMSELSKR